MNRQGWLSVSLPSSFDSDMSAEEFYHLFSPQAARVIIFQRRVTKVSKVIFFELDGSVRRLLLRLISTPQVMSRWRCKDLIIIICPSKRGSAASYLCCRSGSNKWGHAWISARFYRFVHPVDTRTHIDWMFAMTSTITQFSSEIWLCGWQKGVRPQPVRHTTTQIRHTEGKLNVLYQQKKEQTFPEKWPLHTHTLINQWWQFYCLSGPPLMTKEY